MLELLFPMGAVLVSWLVLFLVFSGLGIATLKVLGQSADSGWAWVDGFWLGWVVSLGVMQLWHFVLPVNDALLALLALVAAAALLLHLNNLAPILRRLAKDKPFVTLAILLALWLSNRALGAPVAYDTGFRDMQAVMWIDAYALVPGLGNLFSSLALNQTVYLYDALLDAFIWSDRSHVIATGLLLLVYLIYSTRAALTFLRCRTAADLRWSGIFATLTMPYILFHTAAWGGVSNYLTDTAVDLVGLVSMIYLLDFLQDWRLEGEGKEFLIHRLAIVVVAGFTVKQSFIIFGASIVVFASLVWLRRAGHRWRAAGLARTAGPIAIAACALWIPWMIRGAVTSGYVAYPQSLGRLDIDWTIPVEQVQQRQLNMSTNTRLRGGDRATVLASWNWLGPWLQKFTGNFMPTMLPTLITLVALSLHFVGSSRSRTSKREDGLSPWILAPMFTTLVIWFLTYPEPKYVRYVFWSLAAVSIILALQSWQTLSFKKRKATVLAVTAVGLGYVCFLIIQLGAYPQPAGPEHGFYPVPSVEHRQYITDSGLTLNVPTHQVPQCWRVPLPCTPYPYPSLEARIPGELRHGFRVAG